MTDQPAWDRYVAAERQYRAAATDLLDCDYTEQLRESLRGHGPDGPKSFKTAVHLLDLVPVSWLENNLDVLIDLSLEGGSEWLTLRPLLGSIDPARLDHGLRVLIESLISGGRSHAEDFLATLRLLRDLDRRDLQADIINLAENFADDEVRALAVELSR